MRRPAVAFTPLHGLASLGAGGLAVSVFVWLMFLTPHPGLPVPTAETLMTFRSEPGSGWVGLLMTVLLLLGISHYLLLGWWLTQLKTLQRTEGATVFAGENHIFRMLTPLVLAMSINVTFVLGLVFLPGLWLIKETLFPVALLVFGLLLMAATRRWLTQLRLVHTQKATYTQKGLIELLSAFAFAMIAVGFSATAAMSDKALWHTTGTAMALLGGALAVIAGISVLRTRLPEVGSAPVAPASAGSLLMGVPILTLLGIAAYRLSMASGHHFALHVPAALVSAILGILVLSQVAIFLFALPRLLYSGGWRALVIEHPQGASFSLICPGVGVFVLGMFLVAKGLHEPGWISNTQATVAYTLLGLIQLLTLSLFVHLLLNALPRRKRLKSQRQRNYASDPAKALSKP